MANEQKVKESYDKITPDAALLIDGTVSDYRGKLEISSNFTDEPRVLSKEEYDGSDFIPPERKDLNEMYSQLVARIDSIRNPELQVFLNAIFKEEFKDKFIRHPGAIQIHHNWIGGLMQHTLEVVEYCETSIKLYPSLDKDLLIAGALLHDIGKLEELEVTSRIKGGVKGQLVGHLILGIVMVHERIEASKMDDALKNKLLHLLVSHHGKPEFGSPKEAMIPEAIALYYADEMSSKLCEMTEFISNNKEKTEDEFMYKYHRTNSGTNILLK